MALIRPALLGGLIYLGFVIAYPDYGPRSHQVAAAAILGGAFGLWVLKKLLDLGEDGAKVLLELLFLAGVAGFLANSMPQKSGKAPLKQWAEGARPNRETARRGFLRLGADPDGAVASKIVGFFPKR